MTTAPRASYRLQFHPGFDFDAGAEIVDYLAGLGVSHLYASPSLQAARGSSHGYDVVDPTRVNAELGGTESHAYLCRTLQRHGLGQLLDIVPNHMAIAPGNPWWWDVLENGPASRYANYFDVDWAGAGSHGSNRILLPVLGDHYGRVLEAGEFRLRRAGGSFRLHYHEHLFPLAPASLRGLLSAVADDCASDDLAFIADAFGWLPEIDDNEPERRHRDKEILRRQLEHLLQDRPTLAAAVDAEIARCNADADVLDDLLREQHYRLAYWRTGGEELDYRRFFDIDTLIGLRTEAERVFRDNHALILQWVADGTVDGLRVDHPDGLRDPETYLRRLRTAAPEAWIVVEKILQPDERLRPNWPVAGTTGYEFMQRVDGLLVDDAAADTLTRFYEEFTGQTTDYDTVLRDCKREALSDLLGSDVNRLVLLLEAVCARHRRHRDHTRESLREALVEVIAAFPVYRTYVRAADGAVGDDDQRRVDTAIRAAAAEGPDVDAELLEFLGELLLLRRGHGLEGEFAMRFQQLTPPAMAKGAEDTAFYRYNRFVALNEVGGAPGRFGVPVADFHQRNTEALARWPHGLLATSTHDSKRSGDVRARLAVLSELPDDWCAAVRRWAARNARHKRDDLPDRNMEYLIYQTLVGAWPIEQERLLAYLEKAAREAKCHTSWIAMDPTYESALSDFAEAILADEGFRSDLSGFVDRLIAPGRINSLAQTALKLTAPGVPDIYQGDELWNLSLVDPDNRRPVDFQRRRRLLADVWTMTPETALARADEGCPKLFLLHHGLRLRRDRPAAFGAGGEYTPLTATGRRADHVVAFARGAPDTVTVAPRLPLQLDGDWADTTLALPPRGWRNVLTGDRVDGGDTPLARLLARFPVALLAPETPGAAP